MNKLLFALAILLAGIASAIMTPLMYHLVASFFIWDFEVNWFMTRILMVIWFFIWVSVFEWETMTVKEYKEKAKKEKFAKLRKENA